MSRRTSSSGFTVALLATLSVSGPVLGSGDNPDAHHGHHQFSSDGQDWRSSLPATCQPPVFDQNLTREQRMQQLADEFNLTGQQMQDAQILLADYMERLRDLARLNRESAQNLLQTEPDDPNYWPLAQEVSASTASSAAETVILLAELRAKLHGILTAEQRAEFKRRIQQLKEDCKPEKPEAEATE